MLQEDKVLMLIKGVMIDLPPEDREKIMACAEKLRLAVAEAGIHGSMAVALIVAEAAVAAKQ